MSLLPDDYTSAKGSLFILKPGIEAVVFDMDGERTFAYLRPIAGSLPVLCIAYYCCDGLRLPLCNICC